VTPGDRALLALVAILVVALVFVFGPDRVGQLASAAALLLALWLALRTLAGERPKLRVYSARLVETRVDLVAGVIGALIEVKVINLSRAANAITDAELALVRKGVFWSAPFSDWVKYADGRIQLYEGDSLQWWGEEEPARFPLTLSGLQAIRFVVFGIAPAVGPLSDYGLYTHDEWGAIANGDEDFDEGELDSDIYIMDTFGNTYYQPDPEEGVPSSLIDRVADHPPVVAAGSPQPAAVAKPQSSEESARAARGAS
jgi:hypothetical protein